ncbi:MAG: hypothetical protein QW035_01330 [Candidatus Anstonellales archaeon]
MQVKEKEAVTLYTVLKLLEKREETLEGEQAKTLDYAKKFAELDEKAAGQLEKIVGNRELAVVLANIKPKNQDIVRTIATLTKTDLSDEQVKAILAITAK